MVEDESEEEEEEEEDVGKGPDVVVVGMPGWAGAVDVVDEEL